MTERMRDLRILTGTDVNREPGKRMVIVRDGKAFDAEYEFPFSVEKTDREFMGWGKLDGPVYQLVSDHMTLETCEAELIRAEIDF